MSKPEAALYAPEPAEAAELTAVVHEGMGLVVDTQEKAEAAQDFLVRVKKALARVAARYAPIKADAKAMVRRIEESEMAEATPLLSAQGIVKKGMDGFLLDQREARRKAEADARAAADKAAEDAKINMAAKAEAEGHVRTAQAIMDAPPPAVKVILPPAPKLENVTLRSEWLFRVVNEALVPDEYVTVQTIRTINKTAIGQIVRVKKDKTDIPGIEAYEKTSTVMVGGRR